MLSLYTVPHNRQNSDTFPEECYLQEGHAFFLCSGAGACIQDLAKQTLIFEKTPKTKTKTETNQQTKQNKQQQQKTNKQKTQKQQHTPSSHTHKLTRRRFK